MPETPRRLRAVHWWAIAAAAAVALACSSPGADSGSESSGGDAEEAAAEDSGDWFADTYGTFDPVEHSGEGDGVIELDGITQAMVTATHDGDHYFSISGLDESNQPTAELLVNALGDYSGVTALGMGEAEAVRLEITATGSWTITLAPLSDAPALPESGTGDGVYRYDGGAGTWHVTHSGEHYFSLFCYTGAEFELGLLATEIGAYDGEVAVGAGPGLVVIQADGEWTITPQ